MKHISPPTQPPFTPCTEYPNTPFHTAPTPHPTQPPHRLRGSSQPTTDTTPPTVFLFPGSHPAPTRPMSPCPHSLPHAHSCMVHLLPSSASSHSSPCSAQSLLALSRPVTPRPAPACLLPNPQGHCPHPEVAPRPPGRAPPRQAQSLPAPPIRSLPAPPRAHPPLIWGANVILAVAVVVRT